MSSACDNVELFVDGELPSDEAESFRQHLPDCARCQHELSVLMELKYLGKEVLKQLPSPVDPSSVSAAPPVWRRSGLLVTASFAAGLLVAVAVVRLLPSGATVDAQPLFAQGPERRLEARLPLADADRYRPRARVNTAMSGGGSDVREEVPHGQLSKLRARKEIQELVAALLSQNQQGLAAEALQSLSQLAPSPEREATRSAALFVIKEYDQALAAADSALTMRPGLPQALWNKALALREIHLARMAARTFKEVAALEEPGWAEEAVRHAAELEASIANSYERWRTMDEAGRALLEGPPIRLPERFEKAPSARLYFYDAVRAAPDRGRALALLGLAAKLDSEAGGRQVLQDSVRRVSAADFTKRAPLARDYAELVGAYRRRDSQLPLTDSQQVLLTEPWQNEFLKRLRASRESDLLLGTLVVLNRVQEDLTLLERAGTDDPWFGLLWAQKKASKQDDVEAIQTLLDAYRRECQTRGLEYRCIQLDIDLSGLYLQRHQLSEARKHAERGMEAARAGSEWYLERDLLWQLAQTSKFANDATHLASAFYQEFLARSPDAPDIRRSVYQHLADIAWNELRVDDARRNIDTALATGLPLTVSGAFTLSDLARLRGESEDGARLTNVRLSATTPDERLLATHALGRFIIERDAAQGRALLEGLILQLKSSADSPAARRVRTYSFTSLLFEAGKRRAFEEVLEWVAQERGSELPSRCLLVASVDSERTLLLVRGAEGELVGDYEDSRRERLRPQLDGLVTKESLLAPLRACAQVDVLARPPLHGRAGVLPLEFAWSYLTRRSAAPVPPKPSVKRHLVVSDVELSDPRLQRLNPWLAEFGPDEERVLLQGRKATPANVLAEMQDASEIDLVTHGIINSSVSSSYLLLAREAGGAELTMSKVRDTPLRGAPFVVLAACKAAHTTYSVHEPLSLPAAFFAQGARGVLAATEDIYDVEANAFFNRIRERMREGTPPAIALRDERQAWLAKKQDTHWLKSVLLFE
ncbi:CHAT domain-containing protein [Myxococcus sp. CA040A]|uniref:CHAT domain-containing protein n=1 Tax=Myxococcus sp. CA040A TaxID=2741738 RepID=UPI00157AF820|nr:CHAT domain-containing protein [Myxococcus sp. CA040A]NTX07572.1 CHAT domain-containing protein [Myxococcus sp. CA040A]